MCDVNFNKVSYMQWHETGHITLILDNNSILTSTTAIWPKDWRGYRDEEAWDCDYWNLTSKEIELLQTLQWV